MITWTPCVWMFMAILFLTAINWKPLRCPSVVGWLNHPSPSILCNSSQKGTNHRHSQLPRWTFRELCPWTNAISDRLHESVYDTLEMTKDRVRESSGFQGQARAAWRRGGGSKERNNTQGLTGDGSLLHLNWVNVNIQVVILDYGFARCFTEGKLVKARGISFYNCMWIYKISQNVHFKVKSSIIEKKF